MEEIAIDLVILDLIMPGMGGRRCLEEIRKIKPSAKILVSSGYAPDGSVELAIRSGARAFISKPFELKELLTTVRRVLDKE